MTMGPDDIDDDRLAAPEVLPDEATPADVIEQFEEVPELDEDTEPVDLDAGTTRSDFGPNTASPAAFGPASRG